MARFYLGGMLKYVGPATSRHAGKRDVATDSGLVFWILRRYRLGHDPRNYVRDLSAISQADYFGHRAILARQKPPKPLEGFVKRCVLRWLLLLVAAGSLQAEQAPPTPPSDAIFLWLAGGISSARIQRLAQTRDEALKP